LIPPNTGNIIRLAANTGCQLHLIEPLGFALDDKKLRRAGLDYHEFAGINLYKDWEAFVTATQGATIYGLSTKGSRHYHEASFASGDFLVFGPETRVSNAAALVTYEAWRQLSFEGASN